MSSSDELLVKCKEKIEQLYKEVEDFKDTNRELGSEKLRLEQENESLRITSKGFKGRLQSTAEDYQKEVEKVTYLQEQIVALRDQIARGSATETRVATLKEKINVQNSLVSELRGRVKSMEENAEKKDALIKDWNCAIDQFEKEIQRVSEENHKHIQERELMRSALNHVGHCDSSADQDGPRSEGRRYGGRHRHH